MKVIAEEDGECTECGEPCVLQIEWEEGYGFVTVCQKCISKALSLLQQASMEAPTAERTGSCVL